MTCQILQVWLVEGASNSFCLDKRQSLISPLGQPGLKHEGYALFGKKDARVKLFTMALYCDYAANRPKTSRST